MKNLNAFLASKTDNFLLFHGEGYFYFYITDAGIENLPTCRQEPPENIYVCYLHQMPYDKWCETIEGQLEDYNEDEPTDFDSPPTFSQL
tara:strand:- start:39896 stop:40162 length:267 start_codon:yes stop_codon:yes gene_type:complete